MGEAFICPWGIKGNPCIGCPSSYCYFRLYKKSK